MGEAKSIAAVQRSAVVRDRVTIDLRGIRPRLEAQAASRRMTAASLMRQAVLAMLDEESGSPDIGQPGGSKGEPAVKVTVRLPASHAAVLASRARAADVSQGSYVARLIDGAPAQPPAPNHTQAVAALRASTDRLAALSADLNAFLRLLGRTPQSALEPYRSSLQSLAGDVRVHLAAAATLVAALREARGRR